MAHFVFYDPPPEVKEEVSRLRWQMAGNRMLLACYRLQRLLAKANFNPNQPRVPEGFREGGRWTDGTDNRTPRGNKPKDWVRVAENIKPGVLRDSDSTRASTPLQVHRARARSRREAILRGEDAKIYLSSNGNTDSTAPFYELPILSPVNTYAKEILQVSKETGVDADLIRTVMFMETTHGHYYGLGYIADAINRSNSILPMNVNVTAWGNTLGSRDELAVPLNNIRAGAKILKGIKDSLQSPHSVAAIATLYNDLGETSVNKYGARAQAVYNSRPWDRKK